MPNPLTTCDLHVHLAGSFYAEDLLAIGAPNFREVDWTARDFLSGYNAALNTNLDPVQLFAEALENPETGFARLKNAYVFGPEDSGDFEKFMWKYRLFSHLWGYGWEQGRPTAVSMITQAVEHHKRQGLHYVEYRAGFWGEGADLRQKMQICAETLAAECDDQFTARYIVALPREDAMAMYHAVRQLLAEQPQLAPTIVGIDLASREEGYLPKLYRNLFQQLRLDNAAHPEQALTAVYHVGETFFDKSLESAARWCHEAALLGAKRLGHCIALGLDPAVAVSRRPQAHEKELASPANLCLCTDDPGTFDITLASEIAWVVQHTPFNHETLALRLGNPHRFAL